MDLIYHKNCLDGVYSAYLIYLFSRFLKENTYHQFINYIRSINQSNITDYNFTQLNGLQKHQINQQFFHEQAEIQIHTYGINAGQFHRSYNPKKYQLLIIVDTSCDKYSNIQELSTRYKLIIIIDHHTSFLTIKQGIDKSSLKNVYYIWKEGPCAAKLVFHFLNQLFNFSSMLTPKYNIDLDFIINCVWKNDTKTRQNKESKMFVLGFYYFQIEMSHLNPWLFKRLGCLDLQYVLKKGQNAYYQHLKKIKQQVNRAQVTEFKDDDKRFLLLDLHQVNIRSDIGTILSYISSRNGWSNLAMLRRKNGNNYRISCRSSKHFTFPLALKLAQRFGGGGHKQAAGFQISSNRFNNLCKIIGKPKINLDLTIQEIEQIMFQQSTEQQNDVIKQQQQVQKQQQQVQNQQQIIKQQQQILKQQSQEMKDV